MKYKIFLFFLFFSSICLAQENCENGIDDDGDGKIDLNDSDCICNTTSITSIIPNPSFETYSSCPNNYTELYLATPWIQATNATTDYFNKCGLVAPGIITSGNSDFPDGNGIVGAIFKNNFKEYVGTSLLSPLKAGINYQLTFNIAALILNSSFTVVNENIYEPVDVTLYGCANGINLPINTSSNPNSVDPSWIEIGHVNYGLKPSWGEITLLFTPSIDINAIMIGAPPILPPSYPEEFAGIFPYFLYDNLLLNTAASFGVNITQTGDFCNNNLVLKANLTTNEITNITYQWYKNGVAIFDATNTNYTVPTGSSNMGTYSVKATNKNNCFISKKFTPNFTISKPTVTINQPTCIAKTGTITITTPAQEYSFDNGVTWQLNSTNNSMAVGLHYVKIKTTSGCTSVSTEVVIFAPELLPSPKSVSTQPTCETGGSISITTQAKQYSFDNGLTWSANSIASNLAPNSYIIKIKNDLGCESNGEYITLNPFYLNTPTYTIINPNCGVGGSIKITTSAAQYSFDKGLNWTTNPEATNLQPGFYPIKIKNNLGCESYYTYVYLEDSFPPPPLYSSEQPSCGSETGSGISITINTPAAEYSFNNGVTWTTNPISVNLQGGMNYYLKIKNALGCISYSQTVHTNLQNTTPNAPLITISQPTSCIISTGYITVNTIASQYSFDNGLTWSNNPISNALSMGTYFVRTRESNNSCPSEVATAIINAPPNTPMSPTIKVTQPISCVSPFGSIKVTSSSFEYSFDNGLTYSANPNSDLLDTGTYQVKVRNSSNCESTGVSVIIIPPTDYPSNPAFTTIQPDCNNLKGSITITDNAPEYSFDNGVTWTINTMQSNLDPGTYYIKVKNSNGCISNATTIIIIPFTNFTPKPSLTNPQTFCIQQNETLNSITISGQNIKWYDTLTNGNVLAKTTLLQNSTTYFASQTITGCESERVPVSINIQNTATPSAISPQTFCASQNPTLDNLVITGTSIKWYGSSTTGNVLSISTLLLDGQTYYATQTLNGCESPNRLAITVALISNLPANNYDELFCDNLNDGTETVNLSSYNSSIISNTTDYIFTYYTSLLGAENETASSKITNFSSYKLVLGDNKIYVRINSNTPCYAVAEIKLTLLSKPKITIEDIVPICQNNTITIDAGAGFDSYLWSNGAITQSITVSNPDDFSVTVTDNYATISCSSTKNFTVKKSNKATINTIETKDWTDNENIITVIATGNGVYEYSIDGENYQDSEVFSGLASGKYTVQVRDKNGCGTATDEVYLLMFPKFFTPNGDGYNDTWKIKFSDIELGLSIKIYDRYGKLIKTLITNNDSWNGAFNGTELPSTDYWFVVTRANGLEYKGHFSLKR